MKHKSDIWTHPEPVTMVVTPRTPPRRRQAHYADGVIFAVSVFALIALTVEAAYSYGYTHGQAAKVCASVPGEKVVSSMANTCTYASAYGRATKTRSAI